MLASTGHVPDTPEATTVTVTSGRRVLSVLRKLRERSWGGAHGSMPLFYPDFFISRCLYAHPLPPLSSAQWGKEETLHRFSLRVCPEVTKFSANLATLVEAVDSPSPLQAEARALKHIERLLHHANCSWITSSTYLARIWVVW